MAKTALQRQIENFNPRAREGRDEWFNDSLYSFEDFNPRAREGRDRKIATFLRENSMLP